MIRKIRNEDGIAAITAILVSMVVLSLGVAVVQLSVHNSGASAFDRDRLLVVDAAEAGIDASYSIMERTDAPALPCTMDADLVTTPASHYHVALSYYTAYPPSGSAMACPLTAIPVGVTVTSTGSIGDTERIMQSEARLQLASLGAFTATAIFANSDLTTTNAFTVSNNGTIADVWVKGDYTCSNGSNMGGSILVQGRITISGACSNAGDLWANGSISTTNVTTVGHDATSSTSSISLSGSTHVNNNARSGTTCTGCNATSVGGTITTNSPGPPPPVSAFPQYTYNPAVWTALGYSIRTFTDCTAAQAFIADTGPPATKWLVRITGGCAIGNLSSVNLRDNLAVFTDGAINVSGAVNIHSAVAGTRHSLYLIIPYVNPGTCTTAKQIKFTQVITTTDTDVLMYTPCHLEITNKTNGFTGQMYGYDIKVSNQFSLTYAPIDVPGALSTPGFKVDIAYIREVQS